MKAGLEALIVCWGGLACYFLGAKDWKSAALFGALTITCVALRFNEN
jgi:hypothetical protein